VIDMNRIIEEELQRVEEQKKLHRCNEGNHDIMVSLAAEQKLLERLGGMIV